MTQQILRAHHDERLAEFTMNLSAQHVEIVGGRGDVANLPVAFLQLRAAFHFHLRDLRRIFVSHLQETFKSSATVLGTLSVVTMRKE